MNRFVPLRYEDFKRFASQLKKMLGVRHSVALETVSRACGFQHFHEITSIHREGQPQPVPTTLQCAGDVGFDVWSAQVRSEFRADLQAEMAPDLRCWYRWIFEPSVAPTDWLEPSTRMPVASSPGAHCLEPVPALADVDVSSSAEAHSAAVLVTYRRRRRFTAEDRNSAEACQEV